MTTKRDPGFDKMGEADAAFREIYPVVLAMARRAGLGEIEQQEVAQKVGLVLVEKRDEHDPSKGSRRMWAAGIARNVLAVWRTGARIERERRETVTSVHHLPALSLTPEQAVRAREALALLYAAVREEHREVFELDAFGFSAPEIAVLLGMPETTVEWKLKEARNDMRGALERMGEDEAAARRVRGVLLPFASVDDVARALRGDGVAPQGSAPQGSAPQGSARSSRGLRALAGGLFPSRGPAVLSGPRLAMTGLAALVLSAMSHAGVAPCRPAPHATPPMSVAASGAATVAVPRMSVAASGAATIDVLPATNAATPPVPSRPRDEAESATVRAEKAPVRAPASPADRAGHLAADRRGSRPWLRLVGIARQVKALQGSFAEPAASPVR